MRYGANGLEAEFGTGFLRVHHEYESHRTPAGTEQSFIYCVFRKIEL